MYKNGSLLSIGATTGVKSNSISESTLWGDYTQYVNGGGFALGDAADHACRFEVDVNDHTFINIGTIFSPVSLRFYTKSIDESSMVIDKDTGAVIIGKNVKVLTNASAQLEIHGDVHIIGGLFVNGAQIA
jgi:hypothetical protein